MPLTNTQGKIFGYQLGREKKEESVLLSVKSEATKYYTLNCKDIVFLQSLLTTLVNDDPPCRYSVPAFIGSCVHVFQ